MAHIRRRPFPPLVMKWFNKFFKTKEQEETTAEELTAQEFALAVGIQVLAFTDEEEQLIDDTADMLVEPTLTQCSTRSLYNRPKLDLSLFEPPSHPRTLTGQSLDSSFLLPPTGQLLSSSPGHLLPPSPSHRRMSAPLPCPTKHNQEFVKVEQRGRFTVTTEQSSHFTPKIRTRASFSRFVLETPEVPSDEVVPNKRDSRERLLSVDSGIVLE